MERMSQQAQWKKLETVEDHYDTIVVGGGVIGCATARALAGKGHRILVLESNPSWSKRLAGELLHPAGVAVLEELGVLEPILEAGGVPVRGFAVYPAKGDGAETVLYYAEIGDGTQRGVGVEHGQLVGALRGSLFGRPDVSMVLGRVAELIREGDRVVGVVATDREGVSRKIGCTLLVGADGRQSNVRKMLGLDPGPELISYSAGAVVDDAFLPRRGLGHIFLGAWGPTLAYPMSKGCARLIFDLPPDFSDGRRDKLAQHLRERYLPHLVEPLRSAMEAVLENPSELQLTPNYRAHAKACYVPGAVLVGDASGCMHPMTASGMTNGLNDVKLLARFAPQYLARPSSAAALRAYDQSRRPFFQTRALLARALHEVFRSPSPGARALRQGVFARWHENRAFRLHTMGLLAGTVSNPVVFASQYLSVVGMAAASVQRTAEPRERLRTLLDIGRHSVAHLDRHILVDLVPVPRLVPPFDKAA